MYYTHSHALQAMRKQTKPEVYLDHYLGTIGLWRKPVARDGLCLFRAVSEQLFMTQSYHTNLYDACKIVFFTCRKDDNQEWTESAVMEILSKMYRRDFYVYEEVGHMPHQMTHNTYKDKIILCRINGTHLDSVYPISFQQSSAICQSIIYEILYRNVFELDSELTEAVTLIRDQNKKKMSLLSNRFDDLPDTFQKRPRTTSIQYKEKYRLTPPVPYRIAKALDPCIYRNVELDIWEEEKREQKRETQEHRDKFAPGDKCQVILDGERLYGHIQEIHDDNTAVVFIEELGEKRTVAVSSLKICPWNRHIIYSRSKYSKPKQVFTPSLLPVKAKQYTNINKAPAGAVYTPTTHQTYYQCSPSPGIADISYTQPCDTQQGYSYGPTSCISEPIMTNLNNPCVGMDTSALQGTIQTSKANLNQYANSMLQQCSMQPTMNQGGMVQGGYMYGPMVQQGNSYACVCIPFLDSIAVRDVNINCPPSQDTTGKDLPEVNTLRFFYNLGVENYRNISQGAPAWQSVEMPPVVPSADQINGNMCGQFALPPPPLPQTSSPNNSHVDKKYQQTSNQNYLMCSSNYDNSLSHKTGSISTGSPILKPETNKEDKTSVGDESHDSGCDSDSASGIAHDESFKDISEKVKLKTSPLELEQKIDSYIAADDVEIMEAETTDNSSSVTDNQASSYSRAKKPRKYYMYGSHKLIKPIKDIPPRFLSLLQSSSAERARCEGEPIIIPFNPNKFHQRHRNNIHNSNTMNANSIAQQQNGFNPEAKCFVPGQSSQTSYMQDPSIIACSSSIPNAQPVDPYSQAATAQDSLAYPYSTYGNGVPMYVTSQTFTPTNPTGVGNSSSSLNNSTVNPYHNNSNTAGDGSKLSMPPSLLTGQACASYAPSMQYPVYYAGQGPYTGTQGLVPTTPVAPMPGQMAFSTAYHQQTPAFGLQQQVPALQAAQ